MKKFYIFLIIILGGVVGIINGNVMADDEPEPILPDIYIKAINPGYTVDGVSNVGEMIEIGRKNSDAPISLAGLTISYTNSSGNNTVLVDLSKYIWVAGETFYLRLVSSSELAQVRYTKTLAFKAGLSLMQDDEVLDSVCWTGAEGCVNAFSSSEPTTLVRNLETGEFEHLSNYEILEGGILDVVEDEPAETLENVSVCKNVVFSEILSFYETLQSEQFIELFNNGSEGVRLDECSIKYKNKLYPLSGLIGAEEYFVRYLSDFKLTKNPVSSGTLELIDADGSVVDKLVYPNGQKKGTSFALIGFDASGLEIWRTTYAPTPGEANNFQEFRTCEAGKVINEETGNCVKITSVSEKICGEGQYLNILTGRCKKIPEDAGVKECKEGYVLNEETGRCKKIKNNDGATFALVPETYNENSNFVALWLVLGVVGIGLIYIVYEFRHDIIKLWKTKLPRSKDG